MAGDRKKLKTSLQILYLLGWVGLSVAAALVGFAS
ncbi:hypothetical protein AOP6_1089 [Desulfuromonas sp. AOP6]|nr:hypothetical protein AOP6_1089 [Desulfuromonas sp. AOP6]